MTQQNRNIRIAVRGRENVKYVKREGSPVKDCRRTCRISHHHFVILSGKKQILKQTTDAILLLRIKNRHDEDAGMHDMATMVQCNLSILIGVGTPDKQIRLELHFLPTNLSVD